MPAWAKALLAIIDRLSKALPVWLAYLGGVMRGRGKEQKEQAERDAKAQEDYARIGSERRTADDTADRLRDGKDGF